MTTLEEPLLEAPVFRESTLVPSVLKRRYARLYACAARIACLCMAAALPGRLGNPHLASYVEGANLVVQRVPTQSGQVLFAALRAGTRLARAGRQERPT